jgi:uncharacterized protein (TIGR00369 family)
MEGDDMSLDEPGRTTNAVAPIDRIPFLRLLGLKQDPSDPGSSCLRLPELRQDLCNLLPAAHGGVLMTLLDVAMARAATSHPEASSPTVVTVEMSTRFLRPGRGPLLAEGRVIGSGKSLCTCEAQVRDEQGELVASAMGTFKYWRGAVGGID